MGVIEWPALGHDNQHTWASPYFDAAATTLQVLWSVPTLGLFGPLRSSPAVVNGTVYAKTTTGLVAFSSLTGAGLWNLSCGSVGTGLSSVAVSSAGNVPYSLDHLKASMACLQ